MGNLDEILTLRRASAYGVSTSTALLPKAYGNWLSADIGAMTDVAVATPAVLIIPDTWTYLINDGPVTADAPVILYNGVIQESSVYTFNPSDNVYGLGLIATVTFSVNPTNGVVSCRHGGSLDGAGRPITNMVLALYDLLTSHLGWTLNDFDRGVCEQTVRDLDVLGYPFTRCFAEEKTVREWLLEILAEYHTDFTETGNGQLAIILDRSITTLPVAPDYHILAEEVEDSGQPAAAVQLEMHSEDVCNQVTLHGRHNWAEGDETASYTWDYLQSQSAYQAVYPLELSFRGMYTLVHASLWLNSFARRHGFDPTVVTLTLRGLKFLPLIPPRFVTLEWPLYGWVEHLLKIRKTVISVRNRSVTIECVDCQRELSDTIDDPSASPNLRLRQLSRVYSYVPGTVGETGQLADAPTNPRNECANGDFELGDNGQWDFYAGNAAQQWTVIDNINECYQGRHYVRHVLNAGNGTSVSLRHRLDPGQWFFVSSWFRQHVGGTNGTAIASAFFYDQNDAFLSLQPGNTVTPTTTYLESVAFGQAPANTYYYRPGIGFAGPCTAGQWRTDHVFAASGSLQQVLNARQGDLVARNIIFNGDFELGGCGFSPAGTWVITNDPSAAARSGIWKAAHLPTTSSSEERLSSLTKVAVSVGQVFTLQAYVITLNNPNGTGRLGVSWIDGQGLPLSENATASGAGPFVTYTQAIGSMTVPAGAVYAHVWVGITGHTTPGTFWLIDDWLLTVV